MEMLQMGSFGPPFYSLFLSLGKDGVEEQGLCLTAQGGAFSGPEHPGTSRALTSASLFLRGWSGYVAAQSAQGLRGSCALCLTGSSSKEPSGSCAPSEHSPQSHLSHLGCHTALAWHCILSPGGQLTSQHHPHLQLTEGVALGTWRWCPSEALHVRL